MGLCEREDIALTIAGDDPRKAAFHFLEFGLEEGNTGLPKAWDKDHSTIHYGVEFSGQAPSVTKVLSTLLEQGADPFEIALDEAQFWELHGFYGMAMSEGIRSRILSRDLEPVQN